MNETQIPKLLPDENDWGFVVHCQGCGHEYTHHGRVDVYNRQEDAIGKDVIHTVVEDGRHESVPEWNGNPSARRDGLKVRLSCEHCLSESEIVIYQHKGQTFLDVRLIKTMEANRPNPLAKLWPQMAPG